MTVLVTGARGSIGSALCARVDGWPTDVDTMDVTDLAAVCETVGEVRPSLIYHLAGAKHAPEGELDPGGVLAVNAVGTWNVLVAAAQVGARVITASTCKACDPETAYGASKLLAERMTLAAGHSVARFYNVVESRGNVFETWRNIPAGQPLPVTPCQRYFITIEQALRLLVAVAVLPAGRYTVDPGRPRRMRAVVREVHPGREVELVAPRRGDRVREPLLAACETWEPLPDGIVRVRSVHDHVVARVGVAA